MVHIALYQSGRGKRLCELVTMENMMTTRISRVNSL